jgi:hypothetical protein
MEERSKDFKRLTTYSFVYKILKGNSKKKKELSVRNGKVSRIAIKYLLPGAKLLSIYNL